MKLYELNSEIQSILNEVESQDGVLSDDLEQRLSQIHVERTEKIINIGLLIKNWQAEAAAIKEEESKLAARRKALDNKAERLKQYLRFNLKDDESVSDPRVVIKYRNSDAVKVECKVGELPIDYVKLVTSSKADITAIGAALRAGKVIPGCTLERTLTIK